MSGTDCRAMFSRLSEFLDGELRDEVCGEIRAHMDGCEPCRALLASVRGTIDLGRTRPARPIPEEVRKELRALTESFSRVLDQ